MPDADLMATAVAGSLTDPTVLKAQFTRMMASPKTIARIDDINRQWLRLDNVRIPDEKGRSIATTQSIIASLKEDVLRTLRHELVDRKSKFEDLFTTNFAYVSTPEVAKIYGLDPGETYPKEVQLDGNTRAGFLTRAGMMTTGVTPMLATIRRGKFVRDAILGQAIPDPPPNVVSAPDAKKALAAVDTPLRERLTKATSAYACDFCHRQLNPMGAAFGGYGLDSSWQPSELVDPLGAKRTITVDDTVDPNIQVMGEGMVDGGPALSQNLGQSSEAKLVFAKLWYQALAGRTIAPNNACVAVNMSDALGRGDPMWELFKIFVSSPEFLLKTY